MELLIIKSGQEYIRFIEGDYHCVNLDKASVFPLDQIKVVKKYLIRLEEKGFNQVCIKKLILTEEDL